MAQHALASCISIIRLHPRTAPKHASIALPELKYRRLRKLVVGLAACVEESTDELNHFTIRIQQGLIMLRAHPEERGIAMTHG
jgi:hypothetical protein